jgi:predicted nucleic acid-binding protein
VKIAILIKASSFDISRYQHRLRDVEEGSRRSCHGLAGSFDAELALPIVTIAEIAFGIQKIRPDQRADRLEQGLVEWRRRFADRIYELMEEAPSLMGKSWRRRFVEDAQCQQLMQ